MTESGENEQMLIPGLRTRTPPGLRFVLHAASGEVGKPCLRCEVALKVGDMVTADASSFRLVHKTCPPS